MKCINCHENEANQESGWCSQCESLQANKINGFLYLPALGLVITLVLSVMGGYELAKVLFNYYQNNGFIPRFYIGTIILNSTYLLLILITCYFFFSHRKGVRKFIIPYYLFGIIISLDSTVIFAQAYHVRLTDADYQQMISSIISAVIWIPYFIFSKRISIVFSR